MQNNDKTITIYDIAKEAGVSASTVSRVLTNSANVRSEKKEKIMAKNGDNLLSMEASDIEI